MGGKSSTTTQTVKIPPEVLARYNAVNKQAEAVAQTPFQQYSTDPAAFVAQLNQQQLAGISNVNQAAGSYQPYFAGATGATIAGMGGVNPGELEVGRYMNPFQQSVIDTTMARMQKEQQAAQSGALGTAISSGAFGGDRAGIAAANLAYEQDLSRASTLAGLNAQNFEQAMATAQQQQGLGLSAEQANLARLMAGGQQLAGMGQAYQQAGLQGAEAQINAGTLEQQTEQAGKTALYNQFMQEKAYPFQVAQFLANIAMGTGALSGSTTTTTQPTPFWSDRRLKHDIKRIGKTDDGLPIYTFKYKGDPEEQTHVGFMADEVEQHKPDAVGLAPNGYKYVDYDRATKAGGGGVAGPYGAGVNSQPGAEGYVPQAFLPVGELMIADSQIPQVTNQTLAAQMEAAASFGESLKKLKSDYGDLREWWNKKDAPEQGAVTPGVPNVPGNWRGGVVGYASGGSAEYLKPGLAAAQQPVEPKSYVADTVESQEEAKKSGPMTPSSAPGAPQSTVGKIGEAAGTALSVFKLAKMIPFLSDRRAKHSIRRIGKTDNGMPIYSFKYNGDDRERTHIGFMADEVERKHPDAVSTGPEGLKRVDYSQAHKFYQGGAVRPAYADGGYPVNREDEKRRLGLVSGISADPSGALVPDAPAVGRPGGYQAAATDRGVQSQLAAELAAILNRPKDVPAGLAAGQDYHAMPEAAAPSLASEMSDVSDPFVLQQRAEDLGSRAAINQLYGPKYAGLARAQLEEAGALRSRVGEDFKPYFTSTPSEAYDFKPAGLGYAGLPAANVNAPEGPVGLGVPAIDRAREEFPVGAPPDVVDGLGAAKAPAGVAPPVISAPTVAPTGVAPAATPDKEAAWGYMINRESGNRQFDENGNPLQSPKGAIGAAQIMPATGPEAAKLAGLEWDEQRFLTDPEYNKALGKAYFDDMYRRFGTVDKAMAAYNAGPGALSSAIDRATALGGSYLDYLPKETQDYVRGFTGGQPADVATGVAPAGRRSPGSDKPYEERNAVGRMFYNPDGTVNQDAILSLLAGVGTMASSPSLYLGSSILQGLGGFANAYTGLQKQRADIGLTKAQTAGAQVQTDTSRFFTIGPNGMPMVILGPGKAVTLAEYRANPQLFSTGDRELDARILAEAVKRDAGAATPYTATGAAKPEGIIWSTKSDEAIKRATEMAALRPDLYSTWQTQIAEAIPQYSQARSEAISGKPNVNELAAMVGGAIAENNMGTVEGYLSGTAIPAINAALRTVGAPEISTADSQRQILDKLSALNGAALTPEQERAASVFQMFANVSPNLQMTPEAAATITASIMLQNQQAIDQANYYNGFLSALPMGAPMSEVDAAYAQEYSQLHQLEKANLTQLLEMAGDTSPIGDGSTTRGEYVKRFLTAANSGTVSQEDAQKVLSYLLGENASPLLARYFVKGM